MPRDKKSNFPKTTIERLSYYFRSLEELAKKGVDTISSEALGNQLNIKSSQIRKDLSYFGDFGKRGMGYDVKYLLKELRYILGLDRSWSVIIVGGGNLGKSLADYSGFKKRGFIIRGIFDSSGAKVGSQIGDITVQAMTELPNFIKENNIEIGVIAVPASSAQSVANIMVNSGIKAILNFAPISLKVKDEVRYLSVDLTTKLEALAYYMSFSKDKLWKVFS